MGEVRQVLWVGVSGTQHTDDNFGCDSGVNKKPMQGGVQYGEWSKQAARVRNEMY